jgi:hypothetical protein
MEKWFDRASIILLVVFGLLFVGAKIHFFSRYGSLGLGAYLEEHWPLWAGMIVVVVILNCFEWTRKRIKGSKSK